MFAGRRVGGTCSGRRRFRCRRNEDSREAPDAWPGEWGATLRFFDAKIEAWRSTWHGPTRGVVMPFIAREVGEEIVLEGAFEPGVALRWIFSHITARSFHWRAEESRDGWRSGRVVQEMFATRQDVS